MPSAVTFVFTDIEGSTRLWETEPTRMADALARHDLLCRAAVEAHGGRLVKMIGDGLHAVFDDPVAAVASVLDLQRGMAMIARDCGIPFKMRCGLHAGVAQERDGDYFGSVVNRAARIMTAAHGGQVLLSQSFVDLARGRIPEGADLLHLGRVRLRDLSAPEDVWQLLHSDLQYTFPALRSLDATPNNLPQQWTSFIGREKEIAEVKQLFARTRLLTLTGSGGCGKTRLAIQVAADLLESYPDGIWVVELAALADQGLVPQTVAAVLGLKEESDRSLTQTLAEYLKSRHLLLVLDNAEHLLAACAQLTDDILRQCGQVVLLVTSRENLGIGGELTYRVPSLSVPDPQQDTAPEYLTHYESVRLFIERAQLQRPQFAATAQNVGALASICHRLDGIPLALELAAARMRSLSVEEVNQRLDQQFRLLTGGSRTALPRQQTLRALIDWSYDLLNDAEKALFQRLSVFTGGWTLEAAEHVCIGEGVDKATVLDVLTALADKSLVLAEERSGTTRYRLLETVRQYARERLLAHGDATRWRERHLTYVLAVAEEAESQLKAANQQVWLDRLETEHDNIRSALGWCSSASGDAAGGLRLAGALWRFWYVRGYFCEGRGWLSSLLAAVPAGQAGAACAKALNGAGGLALLQSDYAAANALYEESLKLWRELGDQGGIAGALNNLGNVARERGDYPAARVFYEESLAMKRELCDRSSIASTLSNLGLVAYDQGHYAPARTFYEESLAIGREIGDLGRIAASLNNLGEVVRDQGDYPASRAMHEESLAISRELGDRRGTAISLVNLGNVANDEGDYPLARALLEQSLAIQRELGDRAGIAESLEGLAYASLRLVGPGRAAQFWGAAERLREEIGAPRRVGELPRYDRRVAAARTAISDDAAFDKAWKEGRAMTLEQAIDMR